MNFWSVETRHKNSAGVRKDFIHLIQELHKFSKDPIFNRLRSEDL